MQAKRSVPAAVDLLARAAAAGLKVFPRQGRLVVKGPSAADRELVEAILANKADVMALLPAVTDPEVQAPAPTAPPALPPSAELESLLAEVESQAKRLTADPRLLGAAANLLEDCRAFWREGKHCTALFLARDYTSRIPTYFAGRVREGKL